MCSTCLEMNTKKDNWKEKLYRPYNNEGKFDLLLTEQKYNYHVVGFELQW